MLCIQKKQSVALNLTSFFQLWSFLRDRYVTLSMWWFILGEVQAVSTRAGEGEECKKRVMMHEKLWFQWLMWYSRGKIILVEEDRSDFGVFMNWDNRGLFVGIWQQGLIFIFICWLKDQWNLKCDQQLWVQWW